MNHNTGITADAAATAALVIDGPQPVWMTLNEAREQAFTGEIVFETDPEVLAYLDHGIVYYAERATDASLGHRLLDAGVVDIEQLDRGTVRVGDIEHLGRLFDRDPSVDRDAVVVVAEAATEELIADLANRTIATVRVTAYRHHPSGVHRWFVAPTDLTTPSRPVSEVAQLDYTVVDQLPGLPFTEADELTIEWDEQIEDLDDLNGAFDSSFLETFGQTDVIEDDPELDADAAELSLELAEFSDDIDVDIELIDEFVDAETVDESVDAEFVDEPTESGDVAIDEMDVAEVTVDEVAVADDGDGEDFQFAVVWPDGSEEPATAASASVDDSTAPVDELAGDDAIGDDDVEPAFIESDDGNLEFTMPPLTLSDEPDDDDVDVPDDVADAVRRAIAAIESASVAPTEQLPEIADVDLHDPIDVDLHDPIDVGDAETTADVVATEAPAAGFGGFAPPTMATRAEVLYGQMTDDAATEPTLATSPAGGVASVVFVDDPAEDDSGGRDERSSALRRLIGSLRRKDH